MLSAKLRTVEKILKKSKEHALTAFLWFYMQHNQHHLRYNLEQYGISDQVINEVVALLSETAETLYSIYGFKTHDKIWDLLVNCLAKFNSELEEITRERINKCSEFDRKILKYAASYILAKMEQKGEKFELLSRNVDELYHTVIALLKENVEREYIDKLLASTGLAFRSKHPSAGLYCIIIPPYSTNLIKNLASKAEGEIPSYKRILETFKNLSPSQIAVLTERLYGHAYKFKEIFKAIYGIDSGNLRINMIIDGIYYKGHLNYIIKEALTKALTELVNEYCNKLYNYLKKLRDYKVVIDWYSEDECFYCKLSLNKPGAHQVNVIVMPFPYTSFRSLPENTVLVFEGPIANPSIFRNVVIVGMERNFNGVKVIIDNAGRAWSKDAIKIFKSTKVLLRRSSARKIIQAKPSREVLESIVALVLSELGFSTRVNYQAPSRSGKLIEVDVWAEKRTEHFIFTVYVSCKNWNKEVDSRVVHQEVGRIANLLRVPNLKVLVARKFTEPAKREALASGFVILELGEKVNDENAVEIYEAIHETLSNLFASIASRKSSSKFRLNQFL